MDYRKIYDEIIEYRIKNIPTGYFEQHHILPKSLGGLNVESNKVKLTAREHFIVHNLLTRIYSKEKEHYKKMVYAFWRMCRGSKKKLRISSRDFELGRKLFSENNPQKCEIRQKRVAEKRAAGLYKYDYVKAGKALSATLSKLTKEELSERAKKSAVNCDQVLRAQKIKEGKASIMKCTFKDGTIEVFKSIESIDRFNLPFTKIKYLIKQHNGVDKLTSNRFEFIKKYNGGNQWKK